MKNNLFLLVVSFFIMFFLLTVKPVISSQRGKACPNVPRISAQKAYYFYKSGKAIIVHAGGIGYNSKHIVGSLDIDQVSVSTGALKLPRLPKSKVLIITYCYWGPGETAGAVLAKEYIKRGYRNVRTVSGGGKEMDKIFDYYTITHYGGKIIQPLTGKVIKIHNKK